MEKVGPLLRASFRPFTFEAGKGKGKRGDKGKGGWHGIERARVAVRTTETGSRSGRWAFIVKKGLRFIEVHWNFHQNRSKCDGNLMKTDEIRVEMWLARLKRSWPNGALSLRPMRLDARWVESKKRRSPLRGACGLPHDLGGLNAPPVIS